MAGTQVEIKKAEPKKASNPPARPAYGSNSRARSFNDSHGGFGNYGDKTSGFDYRTLGFDGRFGSYRYGNGSEFNAGYAGFGGGSFESYLDESSFVYFGCFGPYGAGFGGGFSGSDYGGYGRRGSGYGNYGGSVYGGGYDFDYNDSHGGANGMYGKGGHCSSSSRFHLYAK